MALGVALVVLVLLVSLGWRSALIVGLVLPVVSLATLMTMNVMGIAINQMSVTGLIMALGLVVDAAIVMTDDVGKRLASGQARLHAVRAAVRRFFAPLLASTVTTALSFTPMILLPRPAGDFVGSIAMAVVIMLIWSFLIAVLITPAVAGWTLSGKGGGMNAAWIARAFAATIRWSLANPLKPIALALVLPVTGFLSTPTLTAQFFPGVDRDQFHIELELPPGTALSATQALVQEIDADIRATESIQQVQWVIGRSAPAFYYNIVSDRDGAPEFAHALITSASPEGVTGGSLLDGTEQLPVRVRLRNNLNGDLAKLSDMSILPPDAAATAAQGGFPAVPLSALGSLQITPSEGAVTRRNGERVNLIQAYLIHGILPEEALRETRAALAAEGFALPPGYRLEFGGDSDARSSTLNNFIASLGLIITLSLAAVVLTLNSYHMAAVTFVVAGLSAGLSILALAIFQFPFGINAVIGVISSIGVSINAAIILLSGLGDNRAAAGGDIEAMTDVVTGSARHITSTTITTFGGFLPLILAGGGFWPPFAMSVAGGVLLSTVVLFYFTPAAFALLRRRVRVQDQNTSAVPLPLAAE